MKTNAQSRVDGLIHEMRDIRCALSDYKLATSVNDVRLASWVLETDLLAELEITASFVRKLNLQHTMLRQKRPTSTVFDTVESHKLRAVVEQLKSARANLQDRNAAFTPTTQSKGVIDSIHGIAEQVYLEPTSR